MASASSAEAIASKFLADLIKSREQATIRNAGTVVPEDATKTAPMLPVRTTIGYDVPLSQQIASALQDKSNAADQLMQSMDSAEIDMNHIARLKNQIHELNMRLKQLEAQDIASKAAFTTARDFADDRVTPVSASSAASTGYGPLATSGVAGAAFIERDGTLVDISPATFQSLKHTGPPPGYKTRKQREEEERERLRLEQERLEREGLKSLPGKYMKGDMVLSDTTLYVEPNWHTSVSAGPTLECDPLCRSPLESVVVEMLKHVAPGEVGRVGLTPDQSSPRAYIHFLHPESATKLLGLLTPGSTKLLCRVGTHEYRLMRAKPKAGQDYALRPACNQVWIRGSVLPDDKLLQNLSRFGSIVGHTRTAREDSTDAALRAIKTLPTERQWWGAYINFAQQAQLVSLKSGDTVPGLDLPELVAKSEAKTEGLDHSHVHDDRSFSGPRRHQRRARHSASVPRESEDSSEHRDPMQWPELDLHPKKEESLDPAMSPSGARYYATVPGHNGPSFGRQPPTPVFREPLPPQPSTLDGDVSWRRHQVDHNAFVQPSFPTASARRYEEPLYQGENYHGFGGQLVPQLADYYAGGPYHQPGPHVLPPLPPPHPPPTLGYYNGRLYPQYRDTYVDFQPPLGPQQQRHYIPPANKHAVSVHNPPYSDGSSGLDTSPYSHFQFGSAAEQKDYLPLPRPLTPQRQHTPPQRHQHRQPPPHHSISLDQSSRVKEEPDLETERLQQAITTAPGKKAPVDFFRSNLDERIGSRSPKAGAGSAWGSPGLDTRAFKPYTSVLGPRR